MPSRTHKKRPKILRGKRERKTRSNKKRTRHRGGVGDAPPPSLTREKIDDLEDASPQPKRQKIGDSGFGSFDTPEYIARRDAAYAASVARRSSNIPAKVAAPAPAPAPAPAAPAPVPSARIFTKQNVKPHEHKMHKKAYKLSLGIEKLKVPKIISYDPRRFLE